MFVFLLFLFFCFLLMWSLSKPPFQLCPLFQSLMACLHFNFWLCEGRLREKVKRGSEAVFSEAASAGRRRKCLCMQYASFHHIHHTRCSAVLAFTSVQYVPRWSTRFECNIYDLLWEQFIIDQRYKRFRNSFINILLFEAPATARPSATPPQAAGGFCTSHIVT